ncbi:MAG: glycosyltransferase family 39 protein [Undibacterium sp.]
MDTLYRLLQPKPLFALILAFYSLFGSLHLTQFLTADEHYWLYERVPKYWNAWGDWELKKTFINDKPGISLAIVTGPALLALPDTSKHCVEEKNRLYECRVQDTTRLLLAFRLPLLIVNGLILVYLFFLLSRLFDPWTGFFAATLTGLSPILVGMTQIVNPDALLWSTSAAAFFSFFAVLKYGRRRDVIATTIFTALAILSKYTALILFPGFALALLIHFVVTLEDHSAEALHATFKADFYRLLAITLGTTGLVLALVPAFLLDRKYLAEYLATVPDKEVLLFVSIPIALAFFLDTLVLRSKILIALRRSLHRLLPFFRSIALFAIFLVIAVIAARYLFPHWSIYAIPFDIKDLTDARYHSSIPNLFEAFFLEWNAILFSLPPILLVSLLILGIFGLRRKPLTDAPIILTLALFTLSFIIVLIHSNILATARYAIMLFPILGLLGAFGLRELAHFSETRWPHFRSNLALLIIVGSTISLVSIYPFYANYANAFLPKTALIADAWGYGGYEAAEYLNRLPNASKLTVWSDYYGVCEFFVGRCLTAYTFDGNEIKPDYYVLTRRGEARYMSRFDRWERLSGLTAHRYYRQTAISPVWSLDIDNRPGNYVKVFRVEK